ncbi:unnamed protein product, partial [Phaeothamnion confervicola]
NGGNALAVTIDHTPYQPAEAARVRAAGGTVQHPG